MSYAVTRKTLIFVQVAEYTSSSVINRIIPYSFTQTVVTAVPLNRQLHSQMKRRSWPLTLTPRVYEKISCKKTYWAKIRKKLIKKVFNLLVTRKLGDSFLTEF